MPQIDIEGDSLQEQADVLLLLAHSTAEAKRYELCATILRQAAGVFDDLAAEAEAAKS